MTLSYKPTKKSSKRNKGKKKQRKTSFRPLWSRQSPVGGGPQSWSLDSLIPRGPVGDFKLSDRGATRARVQNSCAAGRSDQR